MYLLAFAGFWLVDFGIGYVTCMVLGPGTMTPALWTFLWVTNAAHTIVGAITFISMFFVVLLSGPKK